jgi:hypothetical protein
MEGTMRASLLENLPDTLAGVKTQPLFVMRLNSRMQARRVGSTDLDSVRVAVTSVS